MTFTDTQRAKCIREMGCFFDRRCADTYRHGGRAVSGSGKGSSRTGDVTVSGSVETLSSWRMGIREVPGPDRPPRKHRADRAEKCTGTVFGTGSAPCPYLAVGSP